jgi:amino acid transporter
MAAHDINHQYQPEHHNSSEEKQIGFDEKKEYDYTPDAANGDAPSVDSEIHHDLHRGLKSRQITMIAIGGAIGTGLIIGT